MKGPVRRFGDYLLYLFILSVYKLVPISPYWLIKFVAFRIGDLLYLLPGGGKLGAANVKTAFPDMEWARARAITRASLRNFIWNMTEFLWIDGRADRIEKYYVLPPDITANLKAHVAKGERVIFVNPHLGSWEASGVMAPYYGGVKMAAIAKPVSNPHLNKLLNRGNREKIAGLEIIFSRGAVKAAIKALRDGKGLGTLIDQNTRLRDGGEFVDFFGVPCPSSSAPAALKRYCDAHGIPAVIIYGTSLRHADGKVYAHAEYLPRPFDEYASDKDVLQALMAISERYIREYPEQYLWSYHRFWYIPRDASEEVRAKYPYYSKVASLRFYRARPGAARGVPADASASEKD